MTIFNLFNKIPGVQIVEPDPLDLSPGVALDTIKVRFTDGLLWMPATDKMTVTGAYDAVNERLTLSADFPAASTPSFLSNQLHLATFTLTIAVANDPGGSGAKVLDAAHAAPVSATGSVRWESEMVKWLRNDAAGSIDLALSYQYSPAGHSGFQLALAQPVALERVFANLQAGSLRADVLPEEQALMLTLAGDAQFVAGGTFVDQAMTMLGQIFGPANIPSLDPPQFVFQRKFRLNGNLPGVALSLPTISLLPNWAGGAAPSVDAVEGAEFTAGRPRFTFALPDIGNPIDFAGDLALTLQNSTIRLLNLPGWDGFDLTGNLDFATVAGGGWHLRFEPVMAGMMDLPDFVRWLLSQISWPALALPFLEDLPATLLSLAQNEWYVLFEGLLGSADSAAFLTAFDGLIDGALATNAPFALDDLFALAFRALQPEAGAWFPLLWQNWFERLPGAFDSLLELLRATSQTLSFDGLSTLCDALFDALDPAHLGDVLTTVLEWGAETLDSAFDAFLKLWLPLLAAAIHTLNPADLAAALWSMLANAGGALAGFRQLTDLSAFRLPSIIDPQFFKLRVDVLLIGSGLQALAVTADWFEDALSFSDTGRFFDHITKPFIDFLAVIFPKLPEVGAQQFLGLLFAFFDNAEGDETNETLILQFGRFYFLGVLLALAGAVWNGIRPDHLVPWAGMLFKSIEEDGNLNVKRLDPPGKNGRKYLIFSDLHRDQSSDNTGALNFGSIDHFSVHQQLYRDLLDYADGAGYTVIEAGDGEELWFVRDFEQHPPGERAERTLQDIITTHQAIYDKLADMHCRDRFYRIIGNHDSQLRRPAILRHLTDAIERPGIPFTLYDHLVIPQVKTMDDGLVSIVMALWNAANDAERVNILRDELIFNRFGLDSDPYTCKKPLIVTHGHQWDFWNCDANNLVGKLFANTVGVTFDMINDPFTDMGGINYGGSALVNFHDIFADLFVFNNFPTHVPARRFAHTIQHKEEDDRFLVDDIMYIETLTALVGYLAMPLTHTMYDAAGEQIEERRWSDYLASLGGLNSGQAAGQLFEHLLNQLCVGHTHYPQANPYFDIEALVLGSPLAATIEFVREQIAQHFFGIEPSLNLVKSRYFNSGTAGWQEDVIWAIEINEHGDARLVFWTADTRIDRPQEMDWQLPRMDDALRDLLNPRKAEVERYLAELAQTLGDSLVEIARNIGAVASLPLAFLAAFADQVSNDVTLNVRDFDLLGSADLSTAVAQGHISARLNEVTSWLLTFFLRLMQRQLDGATAGQTFELAVPLPGAIADALAQVEALLSGVVLPDSSTAGDRITELACVWLLANHGAGIVNRANRAEALLRTGYPVAWLVIALIAMLPTTTDPAVTAALPFSVAVATETANGAVTLKLTITIN